jgi:Cu/Ag efflux pump CusA
MMSDRVVDINSSELWVSLDPAADYDATVAAINEVVEGYPGLHHEVQTYLKERSSGVGAAPDNALVVRVYGDNLAALRSAAEEVNKAVAGIDGIAESHVKLPLEEPTVEVEVNLEAAQRYGIKPGDVRRAAAILLSGLSVGNLFEEQKVFDVVVWGTPEIRHSLTCISELLLDTPSGEQVRLGDVAEVRIVSAPTVIQHEAVKSYLDVQATVSGRNPSAVTADIEQRLQDVKFPLEFHAEILGGGAERQAAWRSVLGATIAVAIGVFLLLQAAFGSWRLAVVSFVTLPMALVGGVLAAFVANNTISIGSMVGFFTVFGIAIRSGMLLISHFRHLERSEGETFGSELVLRGARERLGPILMTALATGLAVLPFVLFGAIPGLEIMHPMALVILGGLVTSTLLSLFILPPLYLRFGSSPEPVTLDAPEVSDQPNLGFA